MILARNRKVGNFEDIDIDPARSDNPTPNPRSLFAKQAEAGARVPDPGLKTGTRNHKSVSQPILRDGRFVASSG
jgi:hypothetical protein